MIKNNFKYLDAMLSAEELEERILAFPEKMGWFLSKKYAPHYYQSLFHTMRKENSDDLLRFRHIVSGRRGGKTLSAAWEVLFYCLHPEQFHLDAHSKKSDRPLWVWELSQSYKIGRPAWLTFRDVCIQSGLTLGKEVKENRGGLRYEFENGSLIEFKSAEDPQSLRGAGLDILWMDECAFIKDDEAWGVVRPALSDKQGLVITTTTPNQKNWFYQEWWSDSALKDPSNGRVEYRSIDNPYFRREEWEYVKQRYHPLLFAQEYMASFDSMAGKDLAGDWLHYYTNEDLVDSEGKKLSMRVYMGVDPAISLASNADRFVITIIGVTDSNEVFLLDQYADRIPFPEQLLKIEEYYLRFKPELVGIESNAYQAALVQQTERLNSMPPVIPLFAKGKKFERILAMSPLFRIGKVKIKKDHADFIQEWVDYDSSIQKPKDDCLDSMEIALRTAGALLGELSDPKPSDSLLPDWVLADRPSEKKEDRFVDEYLGSFW